MTARLQRIHALLQTGNVPCALRSRPGLGMVLLAGNPDSGSWDVVVSDNGSQLGVYDARGFRPVPPDSTDNAIADTVKLHVVQAWADQGDPEARAVIAKLATAARGRSNPTAQGAPARFLAPLDLFTFLDPFQFAGQMIDAACQIGSLFLPRPPATVRFAMWSPWGTTQGRYTTL